MIVFMLFVVLQVSNWGNDRSPTSQQEGLETAHTWWRRCRVTSPVVTTGNWSAWIRVFLTMRSHVAPALSSHRSSVSTAAVRGENSVCPSRSQDFTNLIWWFQNGAIHLINIFFLQRQYFWIDAIEQIPTWCLLVLGVSCAFDPPPFAVKKRRSDLVWKILYFSKSPFYWPSNSRCAAL